VPSARRPIRRWPTTRGWRRPAYPVTLILQGQRAMPAVGTLMDDAQIAAVVTYIRTHWGNDYREPVTEQDVRAAR
jgi:mono/diheme cytochrome c family protein